MVNPGKIPCNNAEVCRRIDVAVEDIALFRCECHPDFTKRCEVEASLFGCFAEVVRSRLFARHVDRVRTVIVV